MPRIPTRTARETLLGPSTDGDMRQTTNQLTGGGAMDDKTFWANAFIASGFDASSADMHLDTYKKRFESVDFSINNPPDWDMLCEGCFVDEVYVFASYYQPSKTWRIVFKSENSLSYVYLNEQGEKDAMLKYEQYSYDYLSTGLKNLLSNEDN